MPECPDQRADGDIYRECDPDPFREQLEANNKVKRSVLDDLHKNLVDEDKEENAAPHHRQEG